VKHVFLAQKYSILRKEDGNSSRIWLNEQRAYGGVESDHALYLIEVFKWNSENLELAQNCRLLAKVLTRRPDGSLLD
jgi:hypothetical protein